MTELTDIQTVLIVDDDDLLRSTLERAFRRVGRVAVSAGTSAQAVELVTRVRPQLAVVDLFLGSESGLELIARLNKIDPALEIVVLTGAREVQDHVNAVKLGALNVVLKPDMSAEAILEAVREGREPTTEITSEDTGVVVDSEAIDRWARTQAALAECGGNRTRAARKLGINLSTLHRRLKKGPPKK